jgi:citrate lyase subunit beta/citryl-CoA lyase
VPPNRERHESSGPAAHPASVLFEEGDGAAMLPVCDHYSGVEARMRKSLALQAEWGPVFDVTLDNEDGAPVGAEVEHAHLIAELLGGSDNRWGRVGVRLLDARHDRFADVVQVVLKARQAPAYLMIPKPQGVADLELAASVIDGCGGQGIALHALVETHGALREVDALAAHPRIESLSFGLMDFVSAHRGAIPQSAMGVVGQFTHPLVLRAKLEISAACHAHGKVPSHGVVTEFKDMAALSQAARQASQTLGYTRMWSIHPDQIRAIVQAFSPSTDEVEQALEILLAAEAAQWAPVRHRDTLHDRASYRYFWQRLQRAVQGTALPGGSAGSPSSPLDAAGLASGALVPDDVRQRWFGSARH